ncbi:hypothetical protein FHG87_012735 [Trinorchestia longiramus]|nr:hypothetical protein FHG87_012735 [Trinorchestia longiramus]
MLDIRSTAPAYGLECSVSQFLYHFLNVVTRERNRKRERESDREKHAGKHTFFTRSLYMYIKRKRERERKRKREGERNNKKEEHLPAPDNLSCHPNMRIIVRYEPYLKHAYSTDVNLLRIKLPYQGAKLFHKLWQSAGLDRINGLSFNYHLNLILR